MFRVGLTVDFLRPDGRQAFPRHRPGPLGPGRGRRVALPGDGGRRGAARGRRRLRRPARPGAADLGRHPGRRRPPGRGGPHRRRLRLGRRGRLHAGGGGPDDHPRRGAAARGQRRHGLPPGPRPPAAVQGPADAGGALGGEGRPHGPRPAGAHPGRGGARQHRPRGLPPVRALRDDPAGRRSRHRRGDRRRAWGAPGDPAGAARRGGLRPRLLRPDRRDPTPHRPRRAGPDETDGPPDQRRPRTDRRSGGPDRGPARKAPSPARPSTSSRRSPSIRRTRSSGWTT